MTLAEAKERLTVSDVWRHVGYAGEPSKSCRCPFHEDRSASFSMTPDGRLWNCFAGCGGGDAVDFYRRATGLPGAEACRAFISLAGGAPVAPALPPRPKPAEVDAGKAEQRKTWPPLESPPPEAMAELAALRQVSIAGVKLMAARGLLCFARWKDSPAWIVTDPERVSAQARRMDGKPWPRIGAKAQTLPGSRAAWPIGARQTAPYGVILLCEGGPDLLAAHHFLNAHKREADAAAVAMLGASNRIPPDALSFFAGKRVRVIGHADKAGGAAVAKWAKQLASVGARVDAADFTGLQRDDGAPVKDLNDCNRIRPEDAPELENLIPNEDTHL